MQLAVWAHTVDHTLTPRYAMGGFIFAQDGNPKGPQRGSYQDNYL